MTTGRSRIVAICSAAVLAFVAGCGADGSPSAAPPSAGPTASPRPVESPGPGDHKLTLPWDGKDRTYLLHAPPGYTPGTPIPVVLVLHFYPGTGQAVRQTTDFDKLADKHGFLAVFPDGRDSGFNALVCCGSEDDVGFVGALVKHLTTTWGADPDRVYATGISNGGDLSFKLAVELPDTFAAIAPVSGGFIGAKAADAGYVAKSPVSVLTFIGGKDRYASQFDAGVKTWQQRAACTEGAASAVAEGVTRTAAACADGSEVVTYRLANMSHSWPGAPDGDLLAPDAGVNASELIWEFFAAHPRSP